MTDITVIGAEYLGLLTSVCRTQLGRRLTAIEIDAGKVSPLPENIMPIYRLSLAEPRLTLVTRSSTKLGEVYGS